MEIDQEMSMRIKELRERSPERDDAIKQLEIMKENTTTPSEDTALCLAIKALKYSLASDAFLQIIREKIAEIEAAEH